MSVDILRGLGSVDQGVPAASASGDRDPLVQGSEAPIGDSWGQPPLNRYALTVLDNQHLRGRLLSSRVYYTPDDSASEPDARTAATLGEEFEAWDRLSDEALLDFEEGLA